MTLSDDRSDAWWQQQGYYAGKEIEGSEGLWICLAPMITTNRLMLCTTDSVLDYYCYPRELGLTFAMAAFEVWDGTGDPIDGWVKNFGSAGTRRRERSPSLLVDKNP